MRPCRAAPGRRSGRACVGSAAVHRAPWGGVSDGRRRAPRGRERDGEDRKQRRAPKGHGERSESIAAGKGSRAGMRGSRAGGGTSGGGGTSMRSRFWRKGGRQRRRASWRRSPSRPWSYGRGPPARGVAGSSRLGCELKPSLGAATYGNEARKGLSFRLTPSPSGSLLPLRKPPTTRSSMSTTSSPSLRPFGKPAVSPPMTPKRLLGRARRDAEVDLERVGGRCVRSDLRDAGDPGQQRLDDVGPVGLGHVEAREQDVEIFAGSGLTTYLP